MIYLKIMSFILSADYFQPAHALFPPTHSVAVAFSLSGVISMAPLPTLC